jgi:HlyD family secretion protein
LIVKFPKRLLLYAGLTVVVAALLFYAFMPPPLEVDVATVTRGALAVTVNEDGKTRIKERYAVSSPLAGELLRIDLHPGDAVRAGETILAVIEPGDPSLLDARAQAEAEARASAAEARLLHAEAQMHRARAAHEFALSEHTRAEKLLPSNAVSRADYDAAAHRLRTATEDVRVGEFAVRIAKFELEQAQAALPRSRDIRHTGDSRFEIRSPVNGEVLRVYQESEEAILPGTRLMELGNPSDLEVEVDVLSSDAVRVPLGGIVHLEHWGSPVPLKARVRLVEPQAFLKVSALGVEEQRVNVIADFVDPPEVRQRLGDAYRVEARIVIWEADSVLKVNAGALFRDEGGWAVYRIVNGRARLTTVAVGQSSGLETQITEGLNEGDKVVAYPGDQLHDGARVTLRQKQN